MTFAIWRKAPPPFNGKYRKKKSTFLTHIDYDYNDLDLITSTRLKQSFQ